MTKTWSEEELRSAGEVIFELLTAAENRGEGIPDNEMEAKLKNLLGGELPEKGGNSWRRMMVNHARSRHDVPNHLWYLRFGKAGRAQPVKKTKEKKEPKGDTYNRPDEIIIKDGGKTVTYKKPQKGIVIPFVLLVPFGFLIWQLVLSYRGQ
jgi:hypothetical protein